MADDLTPLYRSLKAAHDAGDKESAQKLANYIRGMQTITTTAEVPAEVPVPSIKEEPPERGIGSTLLQAAGALPGSVANVVKGLGSAIANPKQTAGTMNDLLRGALMKVPGAKFDLAPEDAARAEATVNALTKEYGDTYGSWKGFKNKLATDPMGPILDLSTVMSGGAAAAGKAGTVGKVATAVNPMRVVEAPVNVLASYGAKTAGAVADMGRGPELAAGRIAREMTANGIDITRTPSNVSEVAAQLAKDEATLKAGGGTLLGPQRQALRESIAQSKSILDNASGTQNALASSVENMTSGVRLPNIPKAAKVIPGVGMLSKGVTLANGTLDLLQGTRKFKAETLTKLSEGMATGKSANELLAILPTSEQNKLLQLLQSNPHWLTNPVVQGSLQGVNMMNGSNL